ncbi:12667_t:CDS:2 [Cetraspora pellucida]|uniref:12667_t:CDS:1 n=1 Tax=Cetraspora pellucida TaxID=1433469 RepID=A0A9N9G1F6_9GLOM|nr:12667_t:CDS:2 [Cetraspora pellucida]
MVQYGYPIVNEKGLLTCYIPHQLRKIKLKRSRTSFQIFGKRDEIFDWLEEHGNVVCEYIHQDSHEYDFQENSRSRVPVTERPMLLFELYYDHESSHNSSMIKKILPFNGKKRMMMEIRPYIRGEEYEYHKNLVRRNAGISGVTLRQILDVWTSSPASRRQRAQRTACDYE